jgi:hypothetical protein
MVGTGGRASTALQLGCGAAHSRASMSGVVHPTAPLLAHASVRRRHSLLGSHASSSLMM